MRVNVDMGPVCSTFPLLEDFLLLLSILLRDPRRWCKTGVNDSSNEIGFGIDGVVHLSRVPKYQITGLSTHLDDLAAVCFIPLEILILEGIEVVVEGGEWTLGPVRRKLCKELLKQRRAALHDN